MKSLLLSAASILLCSSFYAQNTDDSTHVEKSEVIQNKIYALPYYSYGKGMGLTSPDSLYQLNIRFRLQSRASFSENADGDHAIDGQVRRLRLRFDGYVGNPKFTYALQLSFAPGDLGGSIHEGDNIQIIRDAVVFYSVTEKFSIGFGQTKLPGNRQRVNSSGALQLTDRSINNASFNIDRDFGLQVNYLNQNKDKFSYNIKGAISQGEGRNFTSNADMHLAYTGKLELYPMGSFKKNGEYFEGDLMREETPKLMVSAAYQFNNKAKLSQGQQGDELFDKRDLHSLFLDAIFKYNGLSIMSAYMSRHTEYPLTFNPDNLFQNDYVYAGKGMDYQASYLFKNDMEIIGRYSWQQMDKEVFQYLPHRKQYTLGLTKYIWEHAFKMQLEGTYNTEQRYNTTGLKDNWYVRFQIEMGI